MKRTTHILLGAAVAMPIAASLSPAMAIGTVWWGMVGGGFPDWFDLKSDFRKQLKHRGFSHSLLAGVLISIGLLMVMQIVRDQFGWNELSDEAIRSWAIAFALGFLSHILADACTIAGVQPFLPLSTMQAWILPSWLRGRSSGHIDTIGRTVAIVIIVASLLRYLQVHLA